MWWLLSHAEFNALRGETTKQMMKERMHSGEAPGIIAYANGEPVGWCSFGPRETFRRLEISPAFKNVLAKVDETSVWSIVCFFVARRFRRRGITESLLEAAVEHVRQRGVETIEGYPIEPKSDSQSASFTGVPSTFRKVGFTEVTRRSERRPIMRYSLQEQRT
jgi:GNAT superfamily N-acetyltransferase